MRCFPCFSTKSSSISPLPSPCPLRNEELSKPCCEYLKNKKTVNVHNHQKSLVSDSGISLSNDMDTLIAKSNGTLENGVQETRRRSMSRSRSKTDMKYNGSITRTSTTTPSHGMKNGYIPGKTPKKSINVKESLLTTTTSSRSGRKEYKEAQNASQPKAQLSANTTTLPKKQDSSSKLSYSDDPVVASMLSKAEQRQIKNQLLASSILSEAVERDIIRNKDVNKVPTTSIDISEEKSKISEKEQNNCLQNMMKTFGIDSGTSFNGCCTDTDVIQNGNSKKNKSDSRMSIDSCAFSEDSSGHSSGSIGSSISVRNEKELLAHSKYCEKRIKELEGDLSEKSTSFQEVKERLSDRELEISILQKRLSLRASSAHAAGSTVTANEAPSKGNKAMPQECDECKRKEKVIDQLYSKLEGLETAVESFVTGNALLSQTPKHSVPVASSSGKSSSPTSNLDLIMKNINELNNLITESRKDVEYVAAKSAQFQKHDVVSLTFYIDGFKVDNNRFRPYEEPQSKNFMKDLADGFYPAEMQGDFPDGVSFLVSDRRYKLYGETVTKSERIAFSGKGRQLESRPSSSASHPSITSLSPFKKSLFPPVPAHSSQSTDDNNVPATSLTSRSNGSQMNKKVADTKPNSTSSRNKGQLEPIKASPLKNTSSSSSVDRQSAHNKGIMKTLPKPAPLKRIISTSGASKGSTQTISKKKDVCQLKIHGIEDSPFLLDLVSYDTVKTLRGVLANVIKTNRISKFMKQTTIKPKDGKASDEKPTMEPMFQLYFGLPKQRLSDDSKTLADLGLSPNGVLHMSRR